MGNKFADASQILPGLWIGNEKVSQDEHFFKEKKIKAVLNCTPDVSNTFCKFDIEYMRLSLGDSRHPENIKAMTDYLDIGASFIYKNRDKENKNILIHCHQGIQRSTTCVGAYLIKYKKMTYSQVIRFLPIRRKEAFYGGTYLTFEQPLKNFSKSIKEGKCVP